MLLPQQQQGPRQQKEDSIEGGEPVWTTDREMSDVYRKKTGAEWRGNVGEEQSKDTRRQQTKSTA